MMFSALWWPVCQTSAKINFADRKSPPAERSENRSTGPAVALWFDDTFKGAIIAVRGHYV
jgi:hypothetical protein